MTPDDVLSFWFGAPATEAATTHQKVQRWFRGGKPVDDEIRARFGNLHERATAGELDDWAQTPRGRRALIIVLDQFTRNLGRNTPKAYAGDKKAQALAIEGLDRGEDEGLAFEELLFLSMPLGHSEDVALHDRNVALQEKHAAAATGDQRQLADQALEQHRKYRDTIRQFGRFPHRNMILERTCTQEEMAFLASPSTNG
jgi:uncharacterized protein (DUF924 family)